MILKSSNEVVKPYFELNSSWSLSCSNKAFFDKSKISSLWLCELCKGQLISKCLFCILNSPKKQPKKFNFTAMVPQVELFLFVFFERELKTEKRHFESSRRRKKDILKVADQ